MTEAACADFSAAVGEPLAATAPRTDFFLLVETPGPWESDPLASPGIPPAARAALDAFLAAVPRSRVQLIRGPAGRQPAAGAQLYWVDARPGHERIVSRRLDGLAEIAGLAGLDSVEGLVEGAAVDHPLLLVCTHGKRDPCCARIGTSVAAELAAALEPEWLWQCSHVGGHRFAANVVWLPYGIYLGRVRPGEGAALAADLRAGRLPLEHLRGRGSLPPAAQAAELELRERLGLRGVDDVVVQAVEEGQDATVVRLRAGGREQVVRVRAEPGAHIVTSCGGEPEAQVRLVATSA